MFYHCCRLSEQRHLVRLGQTAEAVIAAENLDDVLCQRGDGLEFLKCGGAAGADGVIDVLRGRLAQTDQRGEGHTDLPVLGNKPIRVRLEDIDRQKGVAARVHLADDL